MMSYPLNGVYADDSSQVMWEDGGRVFCRGWRLGDDGNRSAVLVVLPAEEHPSSLNRLAHEYGLKDELDGAWAVRPLDLVREGGRTVLVLEDAGGEPLERLLGAPIEVGRFLRLAIATAMALGKLHERGLVHKDIKPTNILVNGATGDVRFTGFGIASRLSRERQAAEPPEALTGTLAYMAPEQTGRINRSIDSRSDLYALGVTFYQMLTGALPFTAADPMEWVHCHLARRPMPPADRVKEIPSAISAIILKLLAKTAEDRYQTAGGLDSDLRSCLAAWDAQRRIDEFPLGEHDIPDRLLIPEKLYGRQREVETLLASFQRVLNSGVPELVLVSGYSGVGKSSVVNELQKELILPRGLFVAGKFDQYKRDTPYATLAQAFQSLVRPLLTKSEGELLKWRSALHDALGPNGELIVNLVPELQLIIGEPAPVPDLPLQDAQRRFQLVLRRFIGVFAKAEHPLAVFLDDLQWIDSATLDLIEDLLTQSGVQHLMLIGAYRENEVDSSHPLMRKLEAIREAGVAVNQVVLAPLTRGGLLELVTDSFHCELERATALVELIHEKTAGNPFFAIQFISALVEEGLVAFDYSERRWSWDLNRIHAKGYADNVVDLMVGKLNRLPVKTQQALQLLACMGNSVEFGLLEMISQQSNEEMHSRLWEAIRVGLILRTEQSYKFLHDRIREAAYSLIPENIRAESHLRIGRLLATCVSSERQEEAIFDVANQLNLGVLAIADTDEKTQIARVNLQAGLRAKASTAYASASNYFAVGLATLGVQAWTLAYQVAFKLVLERAECELLRANLALSGELIALLLSKARSKTDRTEGYRLQVTLQLLHGDMALAVGTALECLKMFDMTFPERPTAEDVREECNDLQRRLGSRSIESLLDLPLMEDPEIRALSGILLTLGQSSYFVNEHLFAMLAFRMVKLSMDFGHSSSGIIGYGGLGIILGPTFDRFDDGERFGRLAVAAAERHGFLAHLPGVYVLLQMASLWTRTIDEALACLDAADKSARETDEVVFACISAEHRVTNMLARGVALDVIWPESVNSLTFVQKKGYAHIIDILLAMQHFIATLRGDVSDDSVCRDEATLLRTGIPVVQCYYWILQLQLRYLMGDAAAAIKAAEEAKLVLWSAKCHVQTGTCRFYYALALLGAMRSAPAAVSQTLQEDLKASFAELRALADSAPHTYAHKHTLVSAELAAADGRDLEAMRLYEQAIRSALEKGFIQDSAVGAELAAGFFTRRGIEKVAQSYRRESRELYLRWGALAKVAQLDRRHPDIVPQTSYSRLPIAETSLEHLDLATVIKVSQAVSGEIVLANLIDTIMRIAMAQAGAERALLILLRGADLRIEAEATTSGDTVAVNLRDQPIADLLLPVSVLQYVLRTRDSLILDDAVTQFPFGEDHYIRQRRVRSILCMPLLNQAKVIGVLYLENSLTPRVFAPARIVVLKLLASQATISLENSRSAEALRRSEAYLAEAERLTHTGSWAVNLRGTKTIVYWSEESYRIYGLDPLQGLPSRDWVWQQVHPDDRSRLYEEIQEAARQKRDYVVEFRILLLDRTIKYLEAIGHHVFSAHGELLEVVGTHVDVTERKRAEEALRESQAKFRDYAESASDWFWEIGPNYKFTSLTENAFGSNATDRIGTACWDNALDLETEPEKWRQVWMSLESREPFRDFVYCCMGGDGSPMYVKASGKPVFDHDGQFRGYRGTGTDVTATVRAQKEHERLRQLESELAHMNRLNVMGELAASLTHEITQPIATARNNARAALNFLDKQPPELGEVREALGCVVSDADRAGVIVDRIRDHIKKAPPRRDRFDLNEAINEVIVLARSAIAKNGVSVQTRLTEGLAPVAGDRVQLQQVMLNLILNATEAMTAVDEGARDLLISTEQSRTNGILVAVRDSGPGIDPEHIERVFDAFYTTKSSGVGMGLSICRSIIAAHGGRLWADANEPRGAVFQFTLPSPETSS